MTTATADQVADYIIWRTHDAGDTLTNLKLQKLLYYAQAWYLALNGMRLFDDTFKAWVHGPVNLTTYHRFKELGWAPILDDIHKPDLDFELQGHIDNALEVYSGFSAYQLELLTHRERPWIEARGSLAPDERCKEDIKDESMIAYYRELLEQNDVEEAT